MRSEQEVNSAIELYSDMILRLCMVNLKNSQDAEDIFQTVFLKYAISTKRFESREHEKAWLIRVTVNACKDLRKNFFHSRTVVDRLCPGGEPGAICGDGSGVGAAEAVPGCDLPSLL